MDSSRCSNLRQIPGPRSSEQVKVTSVHGEAGLTALAPAWCDLADRSASSHLFNDHDWLSAWWQAFSAAEDRLRIYTVTDGERLQAVLPLYSQADPPRRQPRQLGTLFNHYLGRTDMLVADSGSAPTQALIHALQQDACDWDVVRLDRVAEDSPVYSAITDPAQNKLHVYGVRTGASPYLKLQGDCDAWYASRFSSRKRQQDRRRLRQIMKREGEIQRLSEPEAVRACFEEGLQVEALGWKGEQSSAIKSQPQTLSFMRDVVARYADKGRVRLVSIRMEGVLAAFLLGFVHRGTLYFHKTGFDPQFEAQSPGRAVLLESIRWAFEEGLDDYDFLGAPDSYKLQCSPTVRPHTTLFMYNSSARSQFFRQIKRTIAPLTRRMGRPGEGFSVSVDY